MCNISKKILFIYAILFMMTSAHSLNFDIFFEEWYSKSFSQKINNIEQDRIIQQQNSLVNLYKPKISNLGGAIYSQDNFNELDTHLSSINMQLKQRLNGISSFNLSFDNSLVIQNKDSILFRQDPSISAILSFIPAFNKYNLDGLDIKQEIVDNRKSEIYLLLAIKENKMDALNLFFYSGKIYKQLQIIKEKSKLSKNKYNLMRTMYEQELISLKDLWEQEKELESSQISILEKETELLKNILAISSKSGLTIAYVKSIIPTFEFKHIENKNSFSNNFSIDHLIHYYEMENIELKKNQLIKDSRPIFDIKLSYSPDYNNYEKFYKYDSSWSELFTEDWKTSVILGINFSYNFDPVYSSKQKIKLNDELKKAKINFQQNISDRNKEINELKELIKSLKEIDVLYRNIYENRSKKQIMIQDLVDKGILDYLDYFDEQQQYLDIKLQKDVNSWELQYYMKKLELSFCYDSYH